MTPPLFIQNEKLLTVNDPEPVELVGAASNRPVVLVCEHAGTQVPEQLRQLGLRPQELALHIAFDIGAELLSRKMAQVLNCALVLQRYSRLVIDCNRPVNAPDSCIDIADGIVVPGNQHLTERQRAKRVTEIFDPFQHSISQLLDRKSPKAVFSIHSFTPEMAGVRRPWNVSFLFREDRKTSEQLAELVRKQDGELVVGMNEPYAIDDASDWFVPVHGEQRGIRHSLIEVRNEQLLHQQGVDKFAGILARSIEQFLESIPE